MKIICYISLVLSASALIISISDIGSTDSTQTTIILSFFGILVTFLVGWQIYNAFVVKDDLKGFDKRLKGFQDEINEQLKANVDALVKRQNEGMLLLRDITFRNIDAVTSCITLRHNHGVGLALKFVIDNLDKVNDDGGFLRRTLYDAAEGFVSDVVSRLMYNRDFELLNQCIDTIPHNKFCTLYSLDFAKANWSEERIAQFKWWLDIVSSHYPAPVVPAKDEK